MKNSAILAAFCLFFAVSCGKNDEPEPVAPFQFEKPDGWPEPVYNFATNEITQAKFELGRKIFYDPILSWKLPPAVCRFCACGPRGQPRCGRPKRDAQLTNLVQPRLAARFFLGWWCARPQFVRSFTHHQPHRDGRNDGQRF